MDFDLSPEQQQIHKLANEFADREIAPGARERDRAERFPHNVLKKMAPIGFLGGPIPEEYGGVRVAFISPALTTQALRAAASSVRTPLLVPQSPVDIPMLQFRS